MFILTSAAALWAAFACLLYIHDHRTIKESLYDFDDDGLKEQILLKDGRVFVKKDNEIVFETNKEYDVSDFEIGDINNDGQDELVVGFFRYGDYGKNIEIKQTRRDPRISYHVFLYQPILVSNSFKLIWGSSTISNPIYDFEIKMSDEGNYLEVKEGKYSYYDKTGKVKSERTTYWEWNEWWFQERGR